MGPSSKGARLLLALAVLVAPSAVQGMWPNPEAVTEGPRTLCLKRHLDWQAVVYTSDILQAGFDRYADILRGTPLGVGNEDEVTSNGFSYALEETEAEAEVEAAQPEAKAAAQPAGDVPIHLHKKRRHKRCHVVRGVDVSVTSSDQSLTLETRESYSLSIDGGAILIQANSVFGALRGMESLAQLVRRRTVEEVELSAGIYTNGDGSGDAGAWEGFVPEEAVWPGSEGEPEERIAGGVDGPGSGDEVETGLMRKKHHRRHRHDTVLLVDEIDIYDGPRFRYRGLLIDTARHFLPVSVIKDHLDAMTMVKMNCLHWHLTDDQSFPWASEEVPQLAERGAFAPEAVYTSEDIREVVEYARFRGIRVIPELDTPGHTQSWGKSFPGLLTECYNTASSSNSNHEGPEPTGQLGPLNPARNETFGFVWRLLRDLARLFPDPYVHLGGDEVDHECWKSNPEVQAFMRELGFGSDYSRLQAYYMEQVVSLAAAVGKAPIVWQEAFDHGIPLPPQTRVQIWKWWKETGQEHRVADGSSSSSASSSGNISLRAEEGAAAGGGGMTPALRRALLVEQQQERERLSQQQETPQQPSLFEEQGPPEEQGRPRSCDPGLGCEAAAAGEEEAWKAELEAVTGAGYDAILSAPWYLNLGSYAGEDWRRYYAVDPTGFQGTVEQKDRVLGGTACAWGEYIDAVNSINRVWPRAAAVAERLWSPAAATANADEAAARLAELRCRMLSRGIAAQSLGPGFCPGELTTRIAAEAPCQPARRGPSLLDSA